MEVNACINKCNQENLTNESTVKEQMFKLLHAIEDNAFIKLFLDFFSRRLLLYLYEQGVFKEILYNHFDARKDYQLMLDIFNKHSRLEKQDNKATAIIPILQAQLAEKVRK